MKNTLKPYRGYIGDVNFSGDDYVLYGKILGIPDLVTFESKSVTGIQHAFHAAVDDYLEAELPPSDAD